MNAFTAHQPLLFPPIYMIERIRQVQVVVEMTEAQFTRGSGQNTINLVGVDGSPVTFSLPVHSSRNSIAETLLAEPVKSIERLCKTLLHLYCKAPLWGLYGPALLDLLRSLSTTPNLTLAQFNRKTFEHISATFNLMGGKHLISDTDLHPRNPAWSASQWIAALGAGARTRVPDLDTYLCGETSLHGYIDQSAFSARGFKCTPQKYAMPPYLRFPGSNRMHINASATVSILDPLFHLGGGKNLLPLFPRT